MSPTVKPRRFRRLILFVVALASSGCGVANYEKQMQEAEVRAQRIDEENRLLDKPLILPALPKGTVLTLFLRPPKGVSDTSLKGEVPYHYQATGGVCMDVYLVIGEGPDKVKKLIEDDFDVGAQPWQAVTVAPPNRQAMSFESVEFNDPHPPASGPSVYRAYVHQSVGVVYRFLKANRDAANPSLQMSMESYAEGNEAGKASNNFAKRGK